MILCTVGKGKMSKKWPKYKTNVKSIPRSALTDVPDSQIKANIKLK